MTDVIVTPNILTEVSNLASQIDEPARANVAEAFRGFVRVIEERYGESRQAVEQPEFTRLWLTDAAILNGMDNTRVLLTADHGLYIAALNRGLAAENFNYLRQL